MQSEKTVIHAWERNVNRQFIDEWLKLQNNDNNIIAGVCA